MGCFGVAGKAKSPDGNGYIFDFVAVLEGEKR
jgi:hypothetical protein